MSFRDIERRIVDYFEATGCDVVQDGIEWKLSLYDEGPAISLTALAAALMEDLPPMSGIEKRHL